MSPHIPLAFPDLARVARTHTVYGESPLTATAALALLDAGMAPAPNTPLVPAMILRSALDRWMADRMRGIRDFYFALHYGEAHPPDFPSDIRFVLRVSANRLHRIHIGSRLAQAQSMIPGLGEAALTLLDEVSDQALPLLLPQHLLALAGTGKRAAGVIKAARLHARIPHWAMHPRHDALTREGLLQLAAPSRTAFTGKLARALVALDAALREHVGAISTACLSTEFNTWGVALSYEPVRFDTAYTHILDDYQNQRRSPETALFGISIDVGPGLPDQVAAFFAGIAPVFPILAAAQAVIDLLKSRERR